MSRYEHPLRVASLFLDIVFFVEPVHQKYVNKNEQHKNVYRPLLGKPEPQFETANTELIKRVDKKDAAAQ